MHRICCLIGTLVLTALLAGCGPTDIVACDAQGCISEAKLSANITNTLNNKVVGFVAIVGGIPSAFGGQARTAADPPSFAMLPDLQTNLASVSKTLTTVRVLQSLKKHGWTIDKPIASFIYSDWAQGPNIGKITFRDLMTHRSGFREGCGGSNTTFAVLKAQIAAGVTTANMAVGSYNNCNFAIFRELLPRMEGVDLSPLPAAARAQQSADLYISLMNQGVFQPLGIPSIGGGTAQCKPPPAGTTDILSYPNPPGTAHGTDWGDWTLACGGGGWVLTPADLFRVINDIATGNVLLTNDEKTQMFANCLGWDCSVRSDCPNPYVCKNGDLPNGPIAVWTYAGIFKCTVPVVVVVNSFLPAPYQPYDTSDNSIPSNGDIIGVVHAAYNAAAVAGTPKPCSGPAG